MFFLAGLICYFGYHMISGGRGMLAYFKLSSQISSFQSELELVRMERLNLEHSANLLKSESLDLDLLEEQAKKILGYAKPQEIVLIDNE
jgi:cell division protein FtsB